MKSRKGFTLIELLAIIVILGLLMAIAIPSVTRYITESRKKTLTTTVGNYIGALVNEVNDLAYTFTAQNTIYAVPVECIALERGGTNPFGHWYQANDAYFAYVLVQYDDVNSKYVYGFTFKDSAGYGLYPTTQANINEKGKQIKTGLDLNKPITGDITSLTTLAKWQESGFKVDSSTNFQVLEATSEDEAGNGTTTCTLCQKGDNYAQVEEDKNSGSSAYAIYSESENSLTFVRSSEEIKIGDVYGGITVTNVYIGFETADYTYDNPPPWYSNRENINHVNVKDTIKPLSTAFWFLDLNIIDMNLTNLDTSNVTDMEGMFAYAGYDDTTFRLVGLDNWDTSNVINMSWMFVDSGYNASNWSIGSLSNWNTSKVTNMSGMFNCAGHNAATFNIGNLSNWDTSKVTDMNTMFAGAGWRATNWNIGDLSNWNVSSVTNMNQMFNNTGRHAIIFNLELSNWDTSNVVNMCEMFSNAGAQSKNFNIGDLSNWNTSKVTNMESMFEITGYDATWSLDCSSWNVDKVVSYSYFNDGVETKVTLPQWKN